MRFFSKLLVISLLFLGCLGFSFDTFGCQRSSLEVDSLLADFTRHGFIEIPVENLPVQHEKLIHLQEAIDNFRKIRDLKVNGPVDYEMGLSLLFVKENGKEKRSVRGVEHLENMTLDIVEAPELISLYEALIRTGEKAYVRSARINIFSKVGQFLGMHADGVVEPKVKLAGVLYMNDNYEGGELAFQNTEAAIKPRKFSVVLIGPNTPHEVRPLVNGRRVSVAFFVGVRK